MRCLGCCQHSLVWQLQALVGVAAVKNIRVNHTHVHVTQGCHARPALTVHGGAINLAWGLIEGLLPQHTKPSPTEVQLDLNVLAWKPAYGGIPCPWGPQHGVVDLVCLW